MDKQTKLARDYYAAANEAALLNDQAASDDANWYPGGDDQAREAIEADRRAAKAAEKAGYTELAKLHTDSADSLWEEFQEFMKQEELENSADPTHYTSKDITDLRNAVENAQGCLMDKDVEHTSMWLDTAREILARHVKLPEEPEEKEGS